ncbi:MAG TPA: hypothetical protein VIT66_07230 [Lysobacter sp.]
MVQAQSAAFAAPSYGANVPRNPMKWFLPLACALLVACAPALGAQNPSPPAHQALTVDTRLTTADGNSFIAPAGWSIRTAGAAVILTAPEGGSHIAIVDVVAKDADAAVAAGWAAYDAQAKWRVVRKPSRASRCKPGA